MKHQKEKIGIITVNYNNYKESVDCISSLRLLDNKSTENKIYLVDNGSKPDILKKIKKIKDVTLIASKTNLGFAGGNNLGIKKALLDGCTYILLINNDAQITDPKTLVKFLENKNGITAPVVNFLRNNENIFDYGGKVDRVFGRNTHYESPFKLDDFYPNADYYSGVCLFINSNVFSKIGFLNEDYFLYYEDADFCLQAKKANIKLGLDPRVMITHKLSSSANKLGGKKIKIMADSHFKFCLNNLPPMSTPFFLAFNIYLRLKGAAY